MNDERPKLDEAVKELPEVQAAIEAHEQSKAQGQRGDGQPRGDGEDSAAQPDANNDNQPREASGENADRPAGQEEERSQP